MALYWPADVPISYESQKKVSPRVLITKFGDGYEQRTPTNLNPAPRQGTIKVDQPRAVISELEAFLKSTDGWQPFWFTPPPGTPPYLPAGPPSCGPSQPPPYFGQKTIFTRAGIFVADNWTITEKGGGIDPIRGTDGYAILEVQIHEVFEIT